MRTGSLGGLRLAALAIAIAALGTAFAVLFIWGWRPGEQCSSLYDCIRNANVYGYYEAAFYDSTSSPGGTATVKSTYIVSNDQLTLCTGCETIYTSGYGNSTAACTGGTNCSGVLKQTDIIAIVRGMNVSREFRLGTRECFIGTVLSEEPFYAAVCFDEMNRVVNYEEQGKRPFYRFNIAGYETGSLFSET